MNLRSRSLALALLVGLAAASPAQVRDIPARATLVARYPINGAPSFLLPQATVAFDNTTNDSGVYYPNGGATTTITRLVADDLTTRIYGGGRTVSRVFFSTANGSPVTFTARVRIRFFAADRAGGPDAGPGTALIGFTFGTDVFPFEHPAFTAQLWNFDLWPDSFTIPANGKLWIGLAFDNLEFHNATVDDLNSLGQMVYAPATVGQSKDLAFITTNPGSWLSNSPPGSTFDLPGANRNISMFSRVETVEGPVTASGQIWFNDFVGATPSVVRFQWYDDGGTALIAEQDESVDPNGFFTADTPSAPGVYLMSMKTRAWLRRTLAVDTTSGNVSGLVFSLINGDANNDNTINSDDFDLLVANFGGSGSQGDFDGSGGVDSDDFDILVGNFGSDGNGP